MKEAKYTVSGLVEANKALRKIILCTHNLISQKHTLDNDHAGSGKLTTSIGYFSAFELNYGPTHITTGMIQEIIGPGIARPTALALPALNQLSVMVFDAALNRSLTMYDKDKDHSWTYLFNGCDILISPN